MVHVVSDFFPHQAWPDDDEDDGSCDRLFPSIYFPSEDLIFVLRDVSDEGQDPHTSPSLNFADQSYIV